MPRRADDSAGAVQGCGPQVQTEKPLALERSRHGQTGRQRLAETEACVIWRVSDEEHRAMGSAPARATAWRIRLARGQGPGHPSTARGPRRRADGASRLDVPETDGADQTALDSAVKASPSAGSRPSRRRSDVFSVGPRRSTGRADARGRRCRRAFMANLNHGHTLSRSLAGDERSSHRAQALSPGWRCPYGRERPSDARSAQITTAAGAGSR